MRNIFEEGGIHSFCALEGIRKKGMKKDKEKAEEKKGQWTLRFQPFLIAKMPAWPEMIGAKK